jgi:hypothetical protein
MLHEFATANRLEIIARCRARMAVDRPPRPTDVELEYGVPLFLDQLADTLRVALTATPVAGDGASRHGLKETAAKHGNELLQRGFTIVGRPKSRVETPPRSVPRLPAAMC